MKTNLKKILMFVTVIGVFPLFSEENFGIKGPDFTGKPFSEAINLLVFEYNGRFVGDYSVVDKKSGYKFANEQVLLRTQRAIEYMKNKFPDTLARFSFIAEFNRMHIFALDESFQVLDHVIAHSDEYFIPNSGPQSSRDKVREM